MWILTLRFLLLSISAYNCNVCHESFYNLPTCINEPAGYYCNCGPGFKWNSKSCIAAGIDSKMVFTSLNTSYTIFRDVMMPANFTMSLWIKPKTAGVILSMIHDEAEASVNSVILISLVQNTYRQLNVVLQYKFSKWEIPDSIDINTWSHIIWTQKVLDYQLLQWIYYRNGDFQETTVIENAVVLKGSLILGQLNSTHKTKNGNFGFSGDLAHVNIWNTNINASQMKDINEDCLYNFCGNVAQWAHFRYGTHGYILLKWPFGVKLKPCVTANKLDRYCDLACSLRIGAQCKMEISYNVEWERIKANFTVNKKCPMPNDSFLISENYTTIDYTPEMTRTCVEGKWEKPNYQKCILNDWKKLKLKKKELESLADRCDLTNIEMIEGLQLFVNITEHVAILSAIELTMCIEVLDTLIFLKEKQEGKCSRFVIELAEKKEEFLPHYYLMLKLIIKAASNLFDKQNIAGWNHTMPSGFAGRKLLGIMGEFYKQTSANINNLINKYLYTPREMFSIIKEKNIIVKLKASRWTDFRGIAFPDFDDLHEIPEESSGTTVILSEDFLFLDNDTEATIIPTHIVVITALYRDVELKAVHSSRWKQQIKRTGSILRWSPKINGEIIDIAVSVDSKTVKKIKPQSLKIHFKFKENHNISNPKCLTLIGNVRDGNIYSTSKVRWNQNCVYSTFKTEFAVCLCDTLGAMAIATDMFNDDWNKMKPPNDLLALPSYFGCAVSAVLGSITLTMLIYLRTSSNTSAIHKHFSVAIVASQLCYVIGIDKYDQPKICRVFALSLHYFFLSCFAWLMNEAFNLYIVITYAAHSHSDNIDGHMWRFYLMGWIMPGIVVAAIAGINRADYYATNMCWINQNDLWLFCGPTIVVIAVTILVLIFTAKEQHESSYTKNEKDNKAVVNQTKAIWTQIILLPLSWSFAFLVLRMQGIIVKYLFGFFVSLQGLFYIMFYYLLNDEVQKIYLEKRQSSTERRRLEHPDESDQPYLCYNDSYSGESRTRKSSRKDEENIQNIKQKGFFTNVIENLNIRTKHSLTGDETSDVINNDENSDYELITTV